MGGQWPGTGSGFVRKWWWVLDQGVLDNGNFLGGVRGEGTLHLQDILGSMRGRVK